MADYEAGRHPVGAARTFSQATRRRKLARALVRTSSLCFAWNSAAKWSNNTASKSRPPRLRSHACASTRSCPFFSATIETWPGTQAITFG